MTFSLTFLNTKNPSPHITHGKDFNFHSILFSALADLRTRRHCFFRGHEAYVAFGVLGAEQHSSDIIPPVWPVSGW